VGSPAASPPFFHPAHAERLVQAFRRKLHARRALTQRGVVSISVRRRKRATASPRPYSHPLLIYMYMLSVQPPPRDWTGSAADSPTLMTSSVPRHLA
jgi:hypothetical protein